MYCCSRVRVSRRNRDWVNISSYRSFVALCCCWLPPGLDHSFPTHDNAKAAEVHDDLIVAKHCSYYSVAKPLFRPNPGVFW